jgi:predicted SprT family Zn-dependent metalloprotease
LGVQETSYGGLVIDQEDESESSYEDLLPDSEFFRISQDATEGQFLAAAKVYARAVVDNCDLTVDVGGLDWEISKRAKRRAGAVRHQDSNPQSVALTWDYFQANGWAGTAATIRHELIHVHLLNEYDDSSHGRRFKEWAAELDAAVHCDQFTPPRWWVRCTSCGAEIARYRRSKLVKKPEMYQCGECGGELSVERNGDIDE